MQIKSQSVKVYCRSQTGSGVICNLLDYRWKINLRPTDYSVFAGPSFAEKFVFHEKDLELNSALDELGQILFHLFQGRHMDVHHVPRFIILH